METKKIFAIGLIINQGTTLILILIKAQNEHEALGKAIEKNWSGSPLVAFNVREISEEEIRKDNDSHIKNSNEKLPF